MQFSLNARCKLGPDDLHLGRSDCTFPQKMNSIPVKSIIPNTNLYVVHYDIM